jgi:hypothetical protein
MSSSAVSATTRATRLTALTSAAAVVAFALFWALTTQVKSIRAVSPFAGDPWDAFATYAAIFLPFVALPTWIRSLRHREPMLPSVIARRIRWGAGLAAGIVTLATAADLQAIVTVGWPAEAGVAAIAVTGLAAVVIVIALTALVLTARVAMVDRGGLAVMTEVASEPPEPDLVDDLLELAMDVARPLGVGRTVERASAAVERFLDGSAVSPRRHRVVFGVVLALMAAVLFDTWQTIVEGPWVSFVVPVVFGALISSAVLAIYLGTLGPLRLLRPPPS